MKTVLLSLTFLGILAIPGLAAENRRSDSQQLLRLAGDAARTATAIGQAGTEVPESFAVRRSILILSGRITKTAQQWPTRPPTSSERIYRNQCRQRARQMLEDCENLVEAIRSLRNSADAAHDSQTAQQARRMVPVVWELKATTKRLEREVGS